MQLTVNIYMSKNFWPFRRECLIRHARGDEGRQAGDGGDQDFHRAVRHSVGPTTGPSGRYLPDRRGPDHCFKCRFSSLKALKLI